MTDGRYKINVEKWVEDVISKQPIVPNKKIEMQLIELMILRSVIYDNQENWIPQLIK